MNSASEKTLEKIEQEKITPKPRWQFLARQYSVWTLTVVSLLLGALAFSLILYLIGSQNWDIRQAMGSNWFRWIFLSLPLAWILFFLLFVAAIYYNVRHFKKGYKYPAYLIGVSALVTAIFFGVIAASFGLHQKIHDLFVARLPFYQQVFDDRINAWDRPGEGFLAGRINQPTADGFTLHDFMNHDWLIKTDSETEWEGSVKFLIGEQVKVVGQEIDQDTFQAQEIRPWERRGGPVRPGGPVRSDFGPGNFSPASDDNLLPPLIP
jgi:hypothetical protein